MAGYAFLLAVIHVPGITGIGLLSGFNFLSVTLPFMLLGRIQLTPGHWLGVFFLAYAAVSLTWTWQPLTGIETLWHWCLLGGCFCLGHRLESLRSTFIGLGLGIAVSAIVALFQLAGYHPVHAIPTGTHAVAGLFFNPNALSETGAIVLAGLIVYRLWWLTPGAAAALVLGEGRAALVAFSVTAIACFVPARHRLAAALVAIAAVLVASYLRNGTEAIFVRLEVIRVAFQEVPWQGWGAGSFLIKTSHAGYDHLHNDALEVIYEFGLGAIPLFALVGISLARAGMARPILLCFLVVSLFSFPSFMPVTGFVAAVVTGHLYRARGLVWARGAIGRPLVHAGLGTPRSGADPDGGRSVPLQLADEVGPRHV